MSQINYAAALVSGPGSILVGSSAVCSQDDIHLSIDPVLRTTESIMHGKVDQSMEDKTAKLSFRPMPLWENMAIYFPAFFKTAAKGTRLVSADQAVKVWAANNGDLFSFTNGHTTKPPQLLLGADTDPFGPMEMTMLCGVALQLGASGAFMTKTTGQADPTSALSLSNFCRCRWTGTFQDTSGTDGAYAAVPGFTDFEPFAHFVVDFSPQSHVEKVQGLTRNVCLDEAGVQVKCIPLGPTSTQVHTARGLDDLAQGGRIATKAGRLTLSSAVGGHSIVFDHMYIDTFSDILGKPLRNGEICFRNVAKLTSGALQTLVTIT